MKLEKRYHALPMEVREPEAVGTGGGKLAGYAAKFNAESCPLFSRGVGRFVEVIRPGAFSRSLKENPDIRALYNHDASIVLGRTKSGTLRLREDSTGLAFEVDLPDTQAARDVRESVRRGDIDGCSFGFEAVEDEVEERSDGTIIRTLVDVNLIEISPAVAFPAYDDTAVSVRSRIGRRSRPRLALARLKLRILDL